MRDSLGEIPQTTIESSLLRSIGYDAARHVLAVTFRDGAVVEYEDVPLDVFTAFEGALSKGKFFHHAVRGRFTGHKLVPKRGVCPKCGAFGDVGELCTDCESAVC